MDVCLGAMGAAANTGYITCKVLYEITMAYSTQVLPAVIAMLPLSLWIITC